MKYEKAIQAVQSGTTIREAAKTIGVNYSDLWRRCRARGILGGVKQRDTRDIRDKLASFIFTDSRGCVFWTGKKRTMFGLGTTGKVVHSGAPAIAYYLNKPYNPKLRQGLGARQCVEGCLNPDHAGGAFSARDREIRTKYSLSLRYKTTLEEIGKEYGLTRERIRQICVGVKDA